MERARLLLSPCRPARSKPHPPGKARPLWHEERRGRNPAGGEGAGGKDSITIAPPGRAATTPARNSRGSHESSRASRGRHSRSPLRQSRSTLPLTQLAEGPNHLKKIRKLSRNCVDILYTCGILLSWKTKSNQRRFALQTASFTVWRISANWQSKNRSRLQMAQLICSATRATPASYASPSERQSRT